jgi:hypothetical protein
MISTFPFTKSAGAARVGRTRRRVCTPASWARPASVSSETGPLVAYPLRYVIILIFEFAHTHRSTAATIWLGRVGDRDLGGNANQAE